MFDTFRVIDKHQSILNPIIDYTLFKAIFLVYVFILNVMSLFIYLSFFWTIV